MYTVLDGEYIYDLKTVNKGKLVLFDCKDLVDEDKQLIVEVLLPDLKNRNTQIMCYYAWDFEISSKVEIELYRRLNDNTMGTNIKYYTYRDSIQYKKSNSFENFTGMPKRYMNIIKELLPRFREVFV